MLFKAITDLPMLPQALCSRQNIHDMNIVGLISGAWADDTWQRQLLLLVGIWQKGLQSGIWTSKLLS